MQERVSAKNIEINNSNGYIRLDEIVSPDSDT